MSEVFIPAEVREAVAKAIYEHWRSVMMLSPPWEEVDGDWRNGTLGQAEAAVIALFLSWPNFCFENPVPGGSVPGIILPLPEREASDG